MDKKTSKILFRAEGLLIQNKNDDSIYYKELRKTYREYRSEELPDKITNDLYLEHINRLCDLVEQRRNSTVIIGGMICMIIICIFLCFYSCMRYQDISKVLSSKMAAYNEKIKLDIKYEGIENFNAMVMSSNEDYMMLSPLTLIIKPTSEHTINVHYDIYLEEDNDNVAKDQLLNTENLYFNVKTKTRDNGIKRISDASSVRNKKLVFSSETMTNRDEKVDLRMWIDNSNKDSLNKKYRFSINVSCYPV